jgi:hypothetical protein
MTGYAEDPRDPARHELERLVLPFGPPAVALFDLLRGVDMAEAARRERAQGTVGRLFSAAGAWLLQR